jgi:PhoPQ-activated pathogenicity-related protein
VPRREFLAGVVGGAAVTVAARWPAALACDAATLTVADALADYVSAADPSTVVVTLGDGEVRGGRWRVCRLTSQTWKGVAWEHELSLFMPAAARDTGRMLLWIDGGSERTVPRDGAVEPPAGMQTLAAVAAAAGLPAAVVRQVPFQPMFGDLREDGLIAHTFEEFAKTGDPSWPLLLPMVKSAVEAMNAAAAQADEHWGVGIDEFIVTGASKRGWTTWLSAAVDDRVRGIVPAVIDMLSMADHVQLQKASFGRLSEELGDYSSRGLEALLATPRGRDLVRIVDPFAYRDRYTMPKVIALGTNDPYWPLEACSLYFDRLPGPRWLSYAPNAGHGLPGPRVAGLVAALGRHVAGIEVLPEVEWAFAADGRGAAAEVRCEARPDRVTLWTAAAPSRDFRGATWSAEPVQGPGPQWRVPIPAPAAGFAAGLVELQFARDPLPLVLTSGVRVVQAG